jgi:uncharacterized oligopeptide transporter (OPT) family protein
LPVDQALAADDGLDSHGEPLARPHGPELTVQSILAAVLVAGVMGASYPYMVLKLGFGPNVSIVSAFFGFVILSLISLVRRGSYDRWQNNIVQTAGTSAAQTAFMCSVLAAFDMLRASKVVHFTINPTSPQIFVWLTTASLLGVLLAAPMRRHFVVDEKLKFPDGMAAAETLIVLDPPRNLPNGHPERVLARRVALVLGVGLLASALLMLFRADAKVFHLIPEGWDPGALTLGVAGAGFVVSAMGVGVSYSLLNIGSGMLVGLRINLCMLAGGLVGWILMPYLLVTHHILPDHPTRTQVIYWIMWPGVGMIMSGGLTTLLLRWRLLLEAFRALSSPSGAANEFPLGFIGAGVAVLAVALCFIQQAVFGLPLWMSAVAILLSVPLMLVGLRALGETNWGPIGQLSNLMQLLFAGIAPGNVLANIMGNGTTGTIAVTSEGLMQDYKTGHMIGSTPRSMTIAQLIGAPIGAAALAWTYPALVKTYGVVGEHAQLAAPGSRRAAGFAEILSGGLSRLPPSAIEAMGVAILLGILFAVLEQRPRFGRYIPSPVGTALGMLLPFSSVATLFIGGIAGTVWQARNPKNADKYLIPLASGLVAGEALIAVLVAVLGPILLAVGIGHP